VVNQFGPSDFKNRRCLILFTPYYIAPQNSPGKFMLRLDELPQHTTHYLENIQNKANIILSSQNGFFSRIFLEVELLVYGVWYISNFLILSTCSPKWLYQFTLSPAVYTYSYHSTSSPLTLGVARLVTFFSPNLKVVSVTSLQM